jgi:hypothetical protein
MAAIVDPVPVIDVILKRDDIVFFREFPEIGFGRRAGITTL